MPTFEDIFANLKPYIDEYGIKRAGVFGSYARGQAKESSDIFEHEIYPAFYI